MARPRAAPRPRLRLRRLVFVGFLGLAVYAGYEYGRLPDVRPLAKQNPKSTALIEQRRQEAQAEGKRARRRQVWVPLSAISAQAIDAVLVSEDDAFFQHGGLDLAQTKKALEEAWEKKRLGRGASTLTQQLAKNLWLSGDRSLLRKLKEWVLARRLENALEKRRILALYLNVAEWGEGVYGIEAAAQEHFGEGAAELSLGRAAILAAMLPSPRRWTPARRPGVLHERALRIIDRLEKWKRVSAEEAKAARAEVSRALGPT
jgi:monofunctional glycosyltransferase